MNSYSFDLQQADPFNSAYRLFTFYHPQYQPECPTYQDNQYASFILDDRECLGESAYHYHSSVSVFQC